MPATESSDDRFLPTRRSLLSRLRNLGDEVSWRDFFETYWKLIYNTAIKAGLSHEEAQDVVQETVLTLTRTIGDFRYNPEAGSFKGWLLNTTRWRILDQLRRRRPGPQGQSEGDAFRRTGVMDQVVDPVGDEIQKMWDAEYYQNLTDAALRLVKQQVKPKHFQVFELYVLKEWPAAKVAAALDVNIAQVHLLKHRIRSLVRKEVVRLEKQGI